MLSSDESAKLTPAVKSLPEIASIWALAFASLRLAMHMTTAIMIRRGQQMAQIAIVIH